MADYSLLAQALEQEDKRAQSSNPWTTAGSIIGSAKIGQAARSPWEGIAAAVMQGMLSGGLSGYGQQQVQNDKADFSRRWADALNTSDPTAAFAQDEKLAPYASEMRLTQQAQDRSRQDALYNGIANAAIQDATAYGDFNDLNGLKVGFNQDGSIAVSRPGMEQGQAGENRSLIQSAISKGLLGKDLDPTEAEAISKANPKMQSQYLKAAEQAAIADRFGQRFGLQKDQFNRTSGQLKIPGYEPAEGFAPTPTEARAIRDKLASNAQLKESLLQLGQMQDKDGFLNVFGNDAKMRGALVSNIFNTYRKLTNSGARFEGPEAKMLERMTPDDIMVNPMGAINSLMMGRSPAEFARSMSSFVDQLQDVEMSGRGFQPANNVMFKIDPKTAQFPGQAQPAEPALGSPTPQQKYEIRTGPDGKRYKVILGQ